MSSDLSDFLRYQQFILQYLTWRRCFMKMVKLDFGLWKQTSIISHTSISSILQPRSVCFLYLSYLITYPSKLVTSFGRLIGEVFTASFNTEVELKISIWWKISRASTNNSNLLVFLIILWLRRFRCNISTSFFKFVFQ